MKKKELIEAVAELTDITKVKSAEVVETVFKVLAKSAERGERTWIPEIGTFSIRTRCARNVTNPVTLKPMRLKASKTLGFRPSKALRARLG